MIKSNNTILEFRTLSIRAAEFFLQLFPHHYKSHNSLSLIIYDKLVQKRKLYVRIVSWQNMLAKFFLLTTRMAGSNMLNVFYNSDCVWDKNRLVFSKKLVALRYVLHEKSWSFVYQFAMITCMYEIITRQNFRHWNAHS